MDHMHSEQNAILSDGQRVFSRIVMLPLEPHRGPCVLA